MTNPLISIITPTYKQNNYENFHRMIQSVNTQTYGNWEHIVCSDGIYESNVETIIKNYKDFRRKYIVSKQHYGGYGAFVRQEVMTEYATGQYVVFLDDDNFIFPDYLEKMITALQNATFGEKFAICKIVHFGPVIKELGQAPLYIKGEPRLCYIDTLQVMVEMDAIRNVGWVNNHYCADGYTYEELGRRYNYIRVNECLAVHI